MRAVCQHQSRFDYRNSVVVNLWVSPSQSEKVQKEEEHCCTAIPEKCDAFASYFRLQAFLGSRGLRAIGSVSSDELYNHDFPGNRANLRQTLCRMGPCRVACKQPTNKEV